MTPHSAGSTPEPGPTGPAPQSAPAGRSAADAPAPGGVLELLGRPTPRIGYGMGR
ncbi:hypothetical protein Bequi_07040 [Brachybacterium sp. JHP9]|uniref:Uncharacterized protein n=1 Tax=Brachybacterium equifaecis TaxID=2910770 RepID=A0ABT0QZT3_9MICO|nr:hypothetical protein [Brachybacterium equifaecis]MCL6423141.1 hypothetical protein [Brachybacterium equifaecis]